MEEAVLSIQAWGNVTLLTKRKSYQETFAGAFAPIYKERNEYRTTCTECYQRNVTQSLDNQIARTSKWGQYSTYYSKLLLLLLFESIFFYSTCLWMIDIPNNRHFIQSLQTNIQLRGPLPVGTCGLQPLKGPYFQDSPRHTRTPVQFIINESAN